MPRRLEPLHLPFSPPRRLVRDLGPVVEVAAVPMLDPGQDLPFGGAIAAKFIGYNDTRHVLQTFEQLLEKALGRLGVAPALHKDVEHGTVLVDRPPQVVLLAADAQEYLILSAKSGGLGKSGEGVYPCLGARQPVQPANHP